MADAEHVARIRAYLEEHRSTYTREALQAQLLADGHPREAVDLALAQVYGFEVSPAGQSPPPLAPPPSTTGRVVLIALGVFFGNYLLLAVASYLLSSLLDMIDGSLLGLLGLIPLVLLAEGIAARVVRKKRPVLGRGLLWGVGISLLPLAGAALLIGICLALLGASF
jgi:hypothetical protein